MKFKLIALVLALTVISWIQTSSQTPQISDTKTGPAAAADSKAPACHHADAKDGASCCDNMKAEGKDGMSCCTHHDMAMGSKDAMSHDMAMDGKDGMSCCHHVDAKGGQHDMACCGGKDGKSCVKDEKPANVSTAKDGCCPGGACCGKGEACCESAEDSKTTAMACCSGNSCGIKSHREMAK